MHVSLFRNQIVTIFWSILIYLLDCYIAVSVESESGMWLELKLVFSLHSHSLAPVFAGSLFPCKRYSNFSLLVLTNIILKGEKHFRRAKIGRCSINIHSLLAINMYMYKFSSRCMSGNQACEHDSCEKFLWHMLDVCDLTSMLWLV